MIEFSSVPNAVRELVAIGGPVVAILLAMSLITGGVTLYKIWQFRVAGVGRHRVLKRALKSWDTGRADEAQREVLDSRSYMAFLVGRAMIAAPDQGLPDRLDAEAGMDFAKLESGFRLLDSIAQLAPLLGLFGTVLGMIDAFQALQGAGSSVDPSILAGGIWVALLTTAVGLAVAIPTSLILTWLESRVAQDRAFANLALRTILTPREGAV